MRKHFSPEILIILAQRGWQSIAGLVTLAMIGNYLTPVEQGWYYTFASLAALQILFDMGLSVVLLQISAREFIGLKWQERGVFQGESRGRFLAIIRKALVWYMWAAMTYIFLSMFAQYFFTMAESTLNYPWQLPWGLLVVATALNFIVMPVIAIMEGTGLVRKAYAVRLIQSVAGGLATWLVLLNHGGLYALAMMPGVSFLVGLTYLLLQKPHMIFDALFGKGLPTFSWKSEVWPLQWRIGVSWACGYMLLQIQIPLLFRTQGPVAAGQMGLSLAIANMLALLAQSWFSSHFPGMGRAVALRDWQLLDRRFSQGFYPATYAYLGGAILAILAYSYLGTTKYSVRLLPLTDFIGLLAAVFFSHVGGMLSSQLRAFGREPFLISSILGATMMLTASLWVIPRYSFTGIVVAMLLINALFGLPFALWLKQRYNKIWRLELSNG